MHYCVYYFCLLVCWFCCFPPSSPSLFSPWGSAFLISSFGCCPRLCWGWFLYLCQQHGEKCNKDSPSSLNAGQELFVSYLIRTALNWFPKSHNAIRGCHKRTKIKTKTSSGAPYVIFSMLKSVKRQIEGKTKSKNTTKHCQAFREKAGEIFPKGGMPLESIWQAVCTWRDKGNELMAFLFFN